MRAGDINGFQKAAQLFMPRGVPFVIIVAAFYIRAAYFSFLLFAGGQRGAGIWRAPVRVAAFYIRAAFCGHLPSSFISDSTARFSLSDRRRYAAMSSRSRAVAPFAASPSAKNNDTIHLFAI